MTSFTSLFLAAAAVAAVVGLAIPDAGVSGFAIRFPNLVAIFLSVLGPIFVAGSIIR